MAAVDLDLPAPGAPDGLKGAAGADHVACTFDSLPVLYQNCEQLKAMRTLAYGRIHHGVTLSMHQGDPDGNRMEFQVDCFGSNEQANAFVAG